MFPLKNLARKELTPIKQPEKSMDCYISESTTNRTKQTYNFVHF